MTTEEEHRQWRKGFQEGIAVQKRETAAMIVLAITFLLVAIVFAVGFFLK